MGVACLIDIPDVVDGGAGDAGDAALGDGSSDGGSDVFTLDCSAGFDASCVPAIPPGWTAVGLATGAVACPLPEFSNETYLTNPTLTAESCACSACTTTGSWSCSVTLAAGAFCTAEQVTDSGSFCWTTMSPRTSFEETLTRNGTASCTGSQQTGTLKADAAAVTICAPTQCTANYCGLSQAGFKLCVTSTNANCPAAFPVKTVAGATATVACDPCPGCTIVNDDAGCSGEVTAYSSASCFGSVLGSTSMSNTCTMGSNFASSFYFDAGPTPIPVCAPAAPQSGTGTPQLSNPVTICCTN